MTQRTLKENKLYTECFCKNPIIAVMETSHRKLMNIAFSLAMLPKHEPNKLTAAAMY